MLVFWPSRYTQRVVEHLSFLPSGGERWKRDVQLRIPTLGDDKTEPPNGQCIVSLGMFRRCRFPDFTVSDASGKRLTLVTRRQHQHAIAMASLRQFFEDDDWKRAPTDAKEQLLQLYEGMASLIADVRGSGAPSPSTVGGRARRLLEALGKDENETERVSNLVESASELLAKYTHYLCWVPAKWGETVALSASYTMSDSVRIAGAPRKSLPNSKNDPPSQEDPELGWWARFRNRWYTRFNLMPVLYELRAPAHDHAGSYYLTIAPPDDSHVSLLDWGSDRSFGGATAEIDCAFSTCHIHNGERLADVSADDRQSIGGAKISAFLKADPIDHAALLAVAILNVGLAFMAQKGSFLPERVDSQQQWLLLAPTVVVALIAQHHRRYYSAVTAPERAVLWGYLAVNILFGGSVAFDVLGDNRFDDLASGAMACISLALAALLIASGGLFERVTRWRYRRSSGNADPQEDAKRYLNIVRRYADWAVVTILVLTALALAGILAFDWGGDRRERAAAQATQAERQARPAPRRGQASSSTNTRWTSSRSVSSSRSRGEKPIRSKK